MSIQAVAWALDQDIPAGTAKLVLISLANRADHVTGHCWPSMDTIAREASCSVRSVHTYIGALKRNGYIDVRSGRDKSGKGRTNDYWLIMDRKGGKWDWGKTDPPDEGSPPDTPDVDEGSTPPATRAGGLSECISANSAPFADTISATVCRPEPSESNHQNPESVTESERRPSAMRTALHDPRARQADQARLKAAEQARKPKMQAVVQGTRAWAAWLQHGHNPALVTTVIHKGERARGWYFPTLFPPSATGPPVEGAEFADEFDDQTVEVE